LIELTKEDSFYIKELIIKNIIQRSKISSYLDN